MELGDKIVVETETKEDRVALQIAQLLEVKTHLFVTLLVESGTEMHFFFFK